MTDADERELRELLDELRLATAQNQLERFRVADKAIVRMFATLRAQLASAQAERDEAQEQLGHADVSLAKMLGDCVRYRDEADAFRRHYDAAGSPDHNLLALLDLYEKRRDEARAALATAREQLGAAKTLADSWALNSGGYYGLPYSAAAKQLRAALTAPADKETTDGDT